MRIVVKVGTSSLTDSTPRLAPPQLIELARQVCQLLTTGSQIVLVSSGAIAIGRERLGFPQLPKDIPAKQMLAAVGQPRLMALYEQIFGLYGVTVAQILLTRMDLASRRRYLNARNTLIALVEQKVIPIVNENDTVATEEIRVGDNDNLSALVANLVDADCLVLLTDQPGLHTADPRIDPNARLGNGSDDSRDPARALARCRRQRNRIGYWRHDHEAAGGRSGQTLRSCLHYSFRKGARCFASHRRGRKTRHLFFTEAYVR